ncbi:hypothetical protein C8P64_2778 [Christiangramia gaetbulicola]|uniref:Uncharacterized protein n=1 Tax=Christiangramia gaetbulicola TaxID=703340 RepID=A0A2T6AEV7_9FLAO|nr:hypothetical protein [Christiangramia gaetbulicola]PTX42350.1 hypothetical protein C8P64_2778 [Christiangramia gaetbulicola]
MKNFIYSFLIMCCFTLTAQVGIGNSDPKAQLDISATNKEDPASIDGILIPRIDKFPVENPGAAQHGMLIFLDKDVIGSASGFYFWNASETKWKAITPAASGSNFYKPGTFQSPNNLSDLIYRDASIGIGTDLITSRLQVAIAAGKDLTLKKGLEVDNANSATDNLTTYGIINDNRSQTNGNKYGIKSNVGGVGIGIHYGIFNETYQNTGTNDIYGIFNRVGRTFGAKSNNYGIYSEIGSIQGVGNIYGIYSIAIGDSNSNVFAAYFAGRVGIGNTPETEYVLPASRGSEGQIMMTNATGQVTWSNAGFENYSSTTSSTGDFVITDEIGSLRINNQISGLVIPPSASNKGRIIRLINWPGNSEKTLLFQGGDDLFDVKTNSKIVSIKPQQIFTIQSAGNRWILLNQ